MRLLGREMNIIDLTAEEIELIAKIESLHRMLRDNISSKNVSARELYFATIALLQDAIVELSKASGLGYSYMIEDVVSCLKQGLKDKEETRH
jgi:hypothetical protein